MSKDELEELLATAIALIVEVEHYMNLACDKYNEDNPEGYASTEVTIEVAFGSEDSEGETLH
jgi:hypothetical protein